MLGAFAFGFAALPLGGGGEFALAGTAEVAVPGGPVLADIDHDYHDHITIQITQAASAPGTYCLEASYNYSSHHDWEITSALFQRYRADSPVGTKNGLSILDDWSTTLDSTIELDRGPFTDCVELGVTYRYEVNAEFGAFRDSSQDPGPALREARYHLQPQQPRNVTFEAPTSARATGIIRWDQPTQGVETGYGDVTGYAVQYRIDDGSWVDSDPPHRGTAADNQYSDRVAWKLPGTKLEYRVRQKTTFAELEPSDSNVWATHTAIERTANAPPAIAVTVPQAVIQLADTNFPPARLEWVAPMDVSVKYQVYRRPIDGSNAPSIVHATEVSDTHFVESQARTGDTYEYQVRAYSYAMGGGPLSPAVRLVFVSTPEEPAILTTAAANVTKLFGSAFRIEGPSVLTPGRLHEFRIATTSGEARLGGRRRGVVFNAGTGELARWVDADHLGACAGALLCPVRPAGADYDFYPADSRASQWLAYWRGGDTATGLGPDESVQVFVAPDVDSWHTIDFGFGRAPMGGLPAWLTDTSNAPTKQSATIEPIVSVTPRDLTTSLVGDGRVRLAWTVGAGTYSGFHVQRRAIGSGSDSWELVCCRLAPDTQSLVDMPPVAAPGAMAGYEYRVGTYYSGGHVRWLDATARVDIANSTAVVEPWPRFADADRNPSVQLAVGVTVDQMLPTATGGDDPLTYQFTDLNVVGLSFDSTNHKLIGTAVAGSTRGTLSVRDADGDRDELWYEIVVGDPPPAPTGLSARGEEQAITLNWQAPGTTGSAALSGYRIEHSSDGTTGSWKVLLDRAAADVTRHTHSGLGGSQMVHYRVAAVSGVGIGAYVSGASATTAPATVPLPPANFTVVPAFREVRLSWTPPERDGGASITGYRLEWSPTGADADWQTLRSQELASARTYTVSDLWGGRLMHFRVAALNRVGVGAHAVAHATPWAPTRPGAPTAVVATADLQRIHLRWTPPSDDGNDSIRGYLIESSATGMAGSWTILHVDARSTSTAFTHDGLDASQTVHYRVAAINFGGISDFSDSTSVSTLAAGAPAAPAGIDAIPYMESVRVEWGAPGRNGGSEITGYRVQHSATGGAPWTDATTDGADSHYIHTGLTAGQRVHYRVAAVNQHGVGPYTRTVDQSALDGQPPYTEAPNITISDDGSSASLSYGWPLNQAPFPDRVTWEYSFDRWSPTSWIRFETSTTGGANTILKQSGAGNAFRQGYTTYFRMYYSNSAGRGPWTTIRYEHTSAGAPVEISELRGWGGVRSVDLAWTEPFDGGAPISDYSVQYATVGSTWTSLDTQSAVPQYTVTNLTDDTEYQFRVAGTNVAGTGGYSNTVRVSTTPAGTLPDPPIQLQAAVGVGQINLSWRAPPVTRGAAITGYRVEHSADGTSGSWATLVTTADAGTLAHLHTGLSGVQEVHYRAFSVTADDESLPSAPVRAAATPPAPRQFNAFGGRDSVLVEWMPPAEFIGPPVESYRVLQLLGNRWQDAAPQTGSGSTTRLLIRDLTTGQTRQYRAVAINRTGQGGESLPMSARVSQLRPAPPRDVAALMHGEEVEVRWLAPTIAGGPGDRIIGYRVDRSLDDGVSWSTLVANSDTVRTNYVDSAVPPNADPTYRVFAINWRTFGLSLPSGYATVESISISAQPPTDLRVEFGFTHSTIRWEEVSAIDGEAVTGYRVEHAASADAMDTEWQLLEEVNSATITEARHDALPTQDTIYYRVATRTAAGNSRFSVPVGGAVRTAAVVLDLDRNGDLTRHDAQILYYALAFTDLLGDGADAAGLATMRSELLRNILPSGGPNALTDAGLLSHLIAANELASHSEQATFDVNQDSEVTEDDALIMFYARSFSTLLGNGSAGTGEAAMRRTFLAPLSGVDAPSDESLQELLERANSLFGN